MFEGVIVTPLKKYEDDRGWLKECYRSDEGGSIPQMMYISETNPGVSRGPHEHLIQTDIFVFAGPGDFDLHLWDNRIDSPTFKSHTVIRVGESNNVCVIIPPFVIHGYKNVSDKPAFSMNIPNALYGGYMKCDTIDEIRHEELEDEFKI